MVKIGIFTFHAISNLGANLQTLATQQALRYHGCEPVVVNYRPTVGNLGEPVAQTMEEQHAAHAGFVNKYLKQSELIGSEDELREYCVDELDGVLVGSDTVFEFRSKYDPYTLWKWLKTGSLHFSHAVPPYYLNWLKDEDRLFAASIAACGHGTNHQFAFGGFREGLRRGLSRFSRVTVRDDWTKKMVSGLTGGAVDAEVVPDPIFSLPLTFTVPEEDRITEDVSRVVLLSGPFSEAWIGRLREALDARSLALWGMANPENPYEYAATEHNIGLPLSPLKWYQLLSASAGYVGVRFHALVSCLANNTPIVHTDPYRRSEFFREGSKFYDLCRRAGILDRYFSVRSIQKVAPEEIASLLYDESSQARANRYAEYAGKAYLDLIKSLIDQIDARRDRLVGLKSASASG